MRISFLEDDVAQAEVLKDWLTSDGHTCTHYVDARSFLKEVHRESYDLFILDWELSDLSGLEVLERIREQGDWNTPVLFITQRDNENDIIRALEHGADDYMIKPVSQKLLLARVNALFRRKKNHNNEGSILAFGPYRIHTEEASVTVNGETVELTEKEYQLALMLFSNVGRLLSRDHMLETIWGVGPGLATRTVDTHISRLRRKLTLTPENGWRLKAVYHHGYRLEKLRSRETQEEPR